MSRGNHLRSRHPDQERQLFHDLNRLGKKVETGLALQFDRSNPVNQFIADELLHEITDWPEVEKDIVDWDADDGAMPRKDLVSINVLLFLNKTNIAGATPPQVDEKLEVARAEAVSVPYLSYNVLKFDRA